MKYQKMEICIIPVGEAGEDLRDLIFFIKDVLSEVFYAIVRVEKAMEIPVSAYNLSRNQFNSTEILKRLPARCDVTIGIADVDLYANGLNFVFGEAELGGKRAIVSIARLRPYGTKFYGIYNRADVDRMLKIRTLKEVMHELGHVFGLEHCRNPRCVMHFSNSVMDTDLKDWMYCDVCKRKLEMMGIRIKL